MTSVKKKKAMRINLEPLTLLIQTVPTILLGITATLVPECTRLLAVIWQAMTPNWLSILSKRKFIG